jgi:division protein 1
MQRPAIQRSVFNLAKANPREIIRSHFNSSEIEHRAITYIPDDLLKNVKETSSPFSLFEGFQASLPDDDTPIVEKRRKHGKNGSKGQKMLDAPEEEKGPPQLAKLRKQKQRSDHKLQMMGIRKTMCSSEIKEIDTKISNLNTMRKVVLDRLAGLEHEEHDLEQEVGDLAEKLEIMQEEYDDTVALESKTPVPGEVTPENTEGDAQGGNAMDASFMSESIYEKLPKTESKETPKAKRKKAPRTPRKVSMPILHEHMEPGSQIREIPAHNDMITALDFDAPFGTMVTAALDDTVRVWDLSAGRCMGMLEGHLSSVRCLQVDNNWVATGSMDASIKLWDLSQADYIPPPPSTSRPSTAEDQPESATGEHLFGIQEDEALDHTSSQGNAMQDCHVLSLSAHIGEVTALNFRGSTLVSGSADKTLRQWDLETGRCVQTLDVLWAAAQPTNVAPAGSGGSSGDSWFRPAAGRIPAAEADFVGALQVFETALACGTADGMVRLWDLRSGMVHRSLVGHTGPITALQFDDVYLVTGSQDRSIRVSFPDSITIADRSTNMSLQIWDLRTGGIHDAFAYDQPVTSMMFDARRIVSATGEDVVKVYDKSEARQWDCGPGVNIEEGSPRAAAIERVKIKDGYMIEGRRDGVVGVWSC